MLKRSSRVQAAGRPFQDRPHCASLSGCNQRASKCTSMTNPTPRACSPLVLSLQLLLQCCCSFLQLWHPENGGNQRSEAREGRRLPAEPQGANTQGLCVTLQLCFVTTLPNLTFVPNQRITHEWLPAMSCPPAPSSSPG